MYCVEIYADADNKMMMCFYGNTAFTYFNITERKNVISTMCANYQSRVFIKLVRFIMYKLFKWFLRVLKRILKLTLYELGLIAVLCVMCFIIMNWKCPKNNTVIKSPQQPIILWWKSNFPGTSKTRQCSNGVRCDVFSNVNDTDFSSIDAFLFYASNIDFDDLPLPRRAESHIWGLFHEESPRNVEELLHEETLRLFNFSSTFSRNSDVPFPLQHLKSKEDIITREYYVPVEQKNSFLKDISPVMYLQTDCQTSTERDAYVKELMKYIKVDSYGACLKNKELPEKYTIDYLNNLNEDSFLKFIARYKFIIAIENGVCYDYVTEKFWRPIKIGSVPIYFGSPTIKDWFPNKKSAILLKDFPSPKLMADHLMMLSNNDTLYEEYLEHKTKEIITNEKLIVELKEREYQLDPFIVIKKFECLICEKLHSRKEGNLTVNILNQSHYNCPKPTSALTLKVNPSNFWVSSWLMAKKKAKEIYTKVMLY